MSCGYKSAATSATFGRPIRPGLMSAHVLDQPQAFSGTVKVKQGPISFQHDLDSLDRDPAHPDQGTVHRGARRCSNGGRGSKILLTASLPGDELASPNCTGPAPPASPAGASPAHWLIALAVWGGGDAGRARSRRTAGRSGGHPGRPDSIPTIRRCCLVSSVGTTTARGRVAVDPGNSEVAGVRRMVLLTLGWERPIGLGARGPAGGAAARTGAGRLDRV